MCVYNFTILVYKGQTNQETQIRLRRKIKNVIACDNVFFVMDIHWVYYKVGNLQLKVYIRTSNVQYRIQLVKEPCFPIRL